MFSYAAIYLKMLVSNKQDKFRNLSLNLIIKSNFNESVTNLWWMISEL